MAEVFALDSAYLTAKRAQLKDDIAYARYKAGDTWVKTALSGAEVTTDGAVEARFIIDHDASGRQAVSAVELYDRNGIRIGARSVNIAGAAVSEGILCACRLELFQVVQNTGETGAYDAL